MLIALWVCSLHSQILGSCFVDGSEVFSASNLVFVL
jgi:hypothetical protein